MAHTATKKQKKGTPGGIIAALDVGSTKVCCLVAKLEENRKLRILGVGHQSSMGMRAGSVVNMEDGEAAIANAVHTAEQTAGLTIREVCVNLSGGHPTSQTVGVEVAVLDQEVTDLDLRRALSQSRSQTRIGDAEVIHAIPVSYSLDGNRGIRDPRGMYGERLGVQLHLVTADSGPVRNLSTCVARCHLDVGGMVVSAYASGLACLVDDETELGVVCIDMGGGTTSLAVFQDKNLVFSDCIPVGGAHVTNDIARGLATPVAHAERMKILHGSAMSSSTDAREMIAVPVVGEDERNQAHHVPKAELVNIIRPRLEEIFEMVRTRLDQGGFGREVVQRVVLTGGASQLTGVRELAHDILGRQVRLGRPARITGLADTTSGPAFSAAVGLLFHALRQSPELPLGGVGGAPPGSMWGRFGQWLRENL